MNQKAIIILGAAVWSEGVPSPTLRQRIKTASLAAKQMQSAIVICSGGVGRHPPSEAEVMMDGLLRSGIEKGRIFLESSSHSTLDNAKFSIEIMKKHNATLAYVVTDAYHITRAVLTFRTLGMPAKGIASPRNADTPLRRWLWYWVREIVALPVYVLKLFLTRHLDS